MARVGAHRERVIWIDAAKALAVLGVVLLHAAHWVGVAGASSAGVQWVMGRLLVPLPVFFLLSGVLAGASLVAPGASAATLLRRAAPLLWVYLVWQPAVLAYRVIGAVAIADRPVSWAGEAARLIASPVRPNGELWYLWALALQFAVIWATRRVALPWLLPPAIALFAVWGGWGETLIGHGAWHTLGPGLQGLPQFFVFTLLGTRCGSTVVHIIERVRWPAGVAVLLAWQAAAAATAAAPSAALHNLSGIVQIVLGVFATLLIARAVTVLLPARPLRAIGHDSLPVYLAHTIVIVVCLAGVLAVGGETMLRSAPAIATACMVVVGTILPLALYRVSGRGVLRYLLAMPDRLATRMGARADRRVDGRTSAASKGLRPVSGLRDVGDALDRSAERVR